MDPLKALSGEARARLRAWARGELTWAEVEGVSARQARAIARVGCDLARGGRLEEARIVFEGLVSLNPRDGGCHAALGTVLQKLGDLPGARAAYEAALAVDAANPVALVNRGELRLRAGDGGGREDLRRARDADPDGKTASGRRARALLVALAPPPPGPR